VRSGSRTFGAGAAVLLSAGLAGCVTTQEKNARTLLINARTLASESAVHVRRQNAAVTVVSVGFVPGAAHAPGAIAVALRSSSAHALSDLPISIAIASRSGRRVYLNGRANSDYYDAHVPVIPVGARVSWVLPGVSRSELRGGRLFAVVGVAGTPPSTSASVLPRITATAAGQAASDRLPVAIANESSVPQYGLQVYATAIRAGRIVAAARTAIGELDGGARTRVSLPLTGTTAGAAVELFAPPTIFK
jgi:hypothetical protein